MIDLCAGIGRLAFASRERAKRIVCVEMNPEYAAVGKRVLPEAEWIVGDVFSLADLGQFDVAISNPPFGAVKTGSAFAGKYTGARFEYKVIEVASKLAKYGAFIIPQTSAPFRYSGCHQFSVEITNDCQKFMDQTGVTLDHNCGLDTSTYLSEWHGVSPMCEIVLSDFTEPRSEMIEVVSALTAPAPMIIEAPRPAASLPSPAPAPAKAKPQRVVKVNSQAQAQLSLFDAA